MLPRPYDPLYTSLDSGETNTLSYWENGYVLSWNNDGTISARPKYSMGLPVERLRPVDEMGVQARLPQDPIPPSVNPFNWDASQIYAQYFKAEDVEEVHWYGDNYDSCDPRTVCGTKHWVDIGVVGPMREVFDDLGRTLKVGTVYDNEIIVGLKAKDSSGWKTSYHQGDSGHSAYVRIKQMAHVGERKTINHVLKFVPTETGWAKEKFVIDRPGWYEVKVWSKDGGATCCDPSASTTQKILFLSPEEAEDDEIVIDSYDNGDTNGNGGPSDPQGSSDSESVSPMPILLGVGVLGGLLLLLTTSSK